MPGESQFNSINLDGFSDMESSLIGDPSIASLTAQPYPDVPPQNEVDEFLKKKRKAREHKACYPCRQRKVKCDLSRPCQTCRDRDHPELCSYHPPSKRQNLGQSSDGGGFTSSFKVEEVPQNPGGFVSLGNREFDFLCRKLTVLENSITDLKREMKRNANGRSPFMDGDASGGSNIDPAVDGRLQRPTHADVHGVHIKNDAGEVVHVGAGSIPAMFYAMQMDQGGNEQNKVQEMLSRTVLPLFGLDNESATYPFVDLWGLPHGSRTRAQELAKALPTDQQMWHFFRCYKEMGYVIYAGLASLDGLETQISELLTNRARAMLEETDDAVTEQLIYGKSLNWLALIFATLASGAQCSEMPRKERELTSQVYICCSFECLRFTNFLSQSTLESIQSLVLIGNVMTNNLNAGTSWSLLGLTIRLAQGLGIHRACPPATPKEMVYPRSKIWWSIIWQDSLLSITYDRASATGSLDVSTMPPPQEIGPTGAYHSVMYLVSKVGLEIVRDRARPMKPREQISRIAEHRDALAKILHNATDYLRDSRLCKDAKQTLEHWGLYLHSSYHMSELCRPAISPNADPELSKQYKQTCIDNLVNTVEAFLGLNNITAFARQSWAAVHRALSSALMLGILGEHAHNDRAKKLLIRFINVMVDITNNLDAQEISTPIQRGLAALSKLNIQEAQGVSGVNGVAIGKVDNDDVAALITPANSTDLEERSPYSVLNHILWGPQEDHINSI